MTEKHHTHLTPEGNFRSDKYDWCPEGFFAMKFTDPNARKALRTYARLVSQTDRQLARDINTACISAEEEEQKNNGTEGESHAK